MAFGLTQTELDSRIGERYGRLTITAYHHKDQFGRHMYTCHCDCGRDVVVAYTSLRTGHTTSCGCFNREISSADHGSRIGERYNRLTVLAFDHKDERGKLYYHCKCDCGNEKVIRYDMLKAGTVQSCGCLNRQVHSKDADAHIGETWGRLTIIAFDHTDKYFNKFYRCRCTCGNETITTYGSLKQGKVLSCGCFNKEVHTKHGLSHDRIYVIWTHIIKRCYDPKDRFYEIYGGRGITVCDEWRDPDKGLFAFRDWALSHGYADDLTIDRITNDGNYEPANCRWTTRDVQNNNKSSNIYIGYKLPNDSDNPYIIYTCAEWARIVGIDYFNFRNRIINHKSRSINEVIEKSYREGHHLDDNVALEIIIPDDLIDRAHNDNVSESIHD